VWAVVTIWLVGRVRSDQIAEMSLVFAPVYLLYVQSHPIAQFWVWGVHHPLTDASWVGVQGEKVASCGPPVIIV
jgi:hypothetical protein